jgi:hypothetical protein
VLKAASIEELRMRRGLEGIRCWLLFAVVIHGFQFLAAADPVAVRNPEGTLHGFLALTTEDDHVLADGDLIQVVRGDLVTSHLVFHFKDGSVDDETAVFTQRGNFKLIRDRHIQKGPYFPHPLDMLIDVPKGTVTVRSTGKDGKEEVATDRPSLPHDLYNGLITSIVKNVRKEATETTVSMIVATPKPRLVKLAITPRGTEAFLLAGASRKALAYDMKIELGGIVGAVAPLIGKQPPHIQMWVVGGEVPTFAREKGPLFEGGDILTISLVSPVWPKESRSEPSK